MGVYFLYFMPYAKEERWSHPKFLNLPDAIVHGIFRASLFTCPPDCAPIDKLPVRRRYNIDFSEYSTKFYAVSKVLRHIYEFNHNMQHFFMKTRVKLRFDEIRNRRGPIVGLHVRHGDSCRPDEVIRAKRNCTPLSRYMEVVRAKFPSARTIYLATDSSTVVRMSRSYKSYKFIMIPGVFRTEHSSKSELWDAKIWRRMFWHQTDATERDVKVTLVDVKLLSMCDYFVGKFSSNLFRLAYSLSSADCDCIKPYVSLDVPWCFDYGNSVNGMQC